MIQTRKAYQFSKDSCKVRCSFSSNISFPHEIENRNNEHAFIAKGDQRNKWKLQIVQSRFNKRL